jgi:predicted DNA binding CopG/RHH family protein
LPVAACQENNKQGMPQQEKERRIPRFKTIEEEAAFWDSHDSTEFEDEFTEVDDVRFVKATPKKALTVRLEEQTLADLRKLAREKGIGPSTLARMWILERLRSKE